MTYLVLGLLYLIEALRVLLIGRIILEWIRAINPSYRPNKFVLLLSAILFGSTDWIVKPASKIIRPIRVGSGYLDLSILAIFLLLGLIQGFL